MPLFSLRGLCTAWLFATFTILSVFTAPVSANAGRGNAARVAADPETKTVLAIQNGDSVNCRLAQGDNTFVLALPDRSTLDHVTFVNDNAAACGRLRISVADQELPALSAQWVPVDGSIAFARKRLFNVCMVGVNAKFVRITFSVQTEMPARKTDIVGKDIPSDFTAVNAISVYNFRPSRTDLSVVENFRALARSNIEHISANLAMADRGLSVFAPGY